MASSRSFLVCSFFLYFFTKFHGQSLDLSNGVVLPVTKDASSLQYVTTICYGNPLVPVKVVVDLNGPLTWVDCESSHVSLSRRVIPDRSIQCSRAAVDRESRSSSMSSRQCDVFPENGVVGSSTRGELVEDAVAVRSVDGAITTVDQFLFSCAPSLLLKGLATGAKGVLGLGRAPLSLPSQVALSIGHGRKFFMCLSSSNGVVFTPNGILETEISAPLTYTPLHVNEGGGPGGTSKEYTISVRSIKINGKRLSLDTSTFQSPFVTRFSTVVPYTKMETSIYEIFAKAFIKAAESTANMTRVEFVAPFDLCFRSKGFSGTVVPVIDFVLQNEEEMASESRVSRRGSTLGHAVIQRDRVQGNDRLYRDYFAETPTYGPQFFRRRFRMNRPLFLRIQHAIESYNPYFIQKKDAVGRVGLSSLQKISAALRMLAYGVAADSVDEYVRIGESTAIESLKQFVVAIVELFGDEYLRSPNNNDIARLLEINSARGFPGMLGSIDCMHWKWKNCPVAWQGMFSGHIHEPTIILEAVTSYDLWIWHAFFGLPGSLNDINVLDRSTIFNDLAQGRAPLVNYTINGHDYTMGYYLADGIYPSWATFVKTISSPRGNKAKHFAACQESARKDVERAFGVLQSRFAIIRGPARFWDQVTLNYIMKACIIMHNMIIEDERDIGQDYDAFEDNQAEPVSYERTSEVMQFVQTHLSIRNRETHSQLQSDLVEHLWERHSAI